MLQLFLVSCSTLYRFDSGHRVKVMTPHNSDYMMTSSNGNIFPRYWPFVRGIHRSQVNSPHKGQWRGALIFPLICAWINRWVNNREAGDLRNHRAHYDVSVMYPIDHNGLNRCLYLIKHMDHYDACVPLHYNGLCDLNRIDKSDPANDVAESISTWDSPHFLSCVL